jgi:hypothetical protein
MSTQDIPPKAVTMKDLRTICDEAIQLWDADCDMDGVINEMRATLAQPEPVGPTVMEIIAMADEIEEEGLGQIDLVRRALARWGRPANQPVPVGPDVEELAQLIYEQAMIPAARYCKTEVPAWAERGNSFAQDDARDCARAVLSRWGRPAIQPVPVSERLPGAGDCAPWLDEPDANHWCWLGKEISGGWEWSQASALDIAAVQLQRVLAGGGWTHWLPAHALPIPTSQEV